jgi:esterase/lipase
MKKFLGITLGTILTITLGITTAFYATYPSYTYVKPELPTTFEEFYKKRIERSDLQKVRPENDEKLIRYSEGKTEYAILYVHGYGATRKEGEKGVLMIADALKANTYFLRLPGHGTNVEDHRDTPYNEYLQEVMETFEMMPQLGEKVIVIGTSMGGMLTSYLASERSKDIHAIVLANPFFDFYDKTGNLLRYPGLIHVIHLALGKIKVSRVPESTLEEETYKYWYRDQYYESLLNIVALDKFVDRPEVLSKVSCPVLLLYYYKDQEKQDTTADVPAMLRAYDLISKNPNSKKFAIENGNHVLLSEYEPSDVDTAANAVIQYIRDLEKQN